MPVPNLLHPIPIKLRKADRTFTAAYDEGFKEPVGQVRRKQKPIKLVAQINENESDAARATEGGVQKEGDGYALFRTRDLTAARVTLEDGDRIVEIGEGDKRREVDFYIFRFRHMGHYQGPGGSTLLRAYYHDRSPSRVRS